MESETSKVRQRIGQGCSFLKCFKHANVCTSLFRLYDVTSLVCVIVGLRSKLDYIKNLGVSGVILSSVYATGSDPSPESVTDFKSTHPDFGTLDEFKQLLSDMKAQGLYF